MSWPLPSSSPPPLPAPSRSSSLLRRGVSFQAASNSMLLQREASAQAGHPGQPGQSQGSQQHQQQQQQQGKWPAGGNGNTTVSSKQLSLELDHVEREIGKRTREMAMVRHKTIPGSFLRSQFSVST